MLVNAKSISELYKGMMVLTPMNEEATVVKLYETKGRIDNFERVDLKYTGSNYHKVWNNMVVLQPKLIRYNLE